MKKSFHIYLHVVMNLMGPIKKLNIEETYNIQLILSDKTIIAPK